MNLVNWTPFRDMEGFFDRYYDLMDRSALPAADSKLAKQLKWRPTVDISETKKHYVIKAELPDVEKEDVDVSVENGVLTISGERRYEKDDESETQHRIERVYGKFTRSFTLPSDADESAISARSRNGVLKIRIPKTVETKDEPVRISVE